MKITIDMTDEDFERLTTTSTSWADSWDRKGTRTDGRDVSWRRQVADGRFEHSQKDFETEPESHWLVAYWVGPEWINVLMCRSFLDGLGYEYEILLDLAHEEGQMPEYLILTDYLAPAWKRNEVKGTEEGTRGE